MKDYPIIKFFKTLHKVNKAEIEEIKSLQISDEDKEQAERIANICIAVLASQGIPTGLITREILQKAISYGLRDLKDGIQSPDKLIINRIIKELKNNDI